MRQCGACGHKFSGRPRRGHVLMQCPECEEIRGTTLAAAGDEIDIAVEHIIAAADLLGWTFAVHKVGAGGEAHTDGFVIGMETYVDDMTDAYKDVVARRGE